VNVGSSVAAASVVPFLAAALASCSGDVIGEFPSPPPPAITASSASPQDEGNEDILAEIAVDGSPCFLAEAAGRVWVTAFDGDALVEIDPATDEVVDTHPVPDGPCGIVASDEALWIESQDAGVVAVFDPARGRVIDRIRFEGGITGLTPTTSALWGYAEAVEQMVEIDPRTRMIVGRVHVEEPVTWVMADGDEVWIVAGRSELIRIDPDTDAIAERITLNSFEAEGLALGGDTLWVSSSFEGDVLRVDRRTGQVIDRLPVDGSLFGGVVIGDSYWVSDDDGIVYRLDARSGDLVETIEFVGFGPIPAAGSLWTVDFVSSTVFRLDEPAA
jgi:DNA-binding beta-propeller fold protein YncE